MGVIVEKDRVLFFRDIEVLFLEVFGDYLHSFCDKYKVEVTVCETLKSFFEIELHRDNGKSISFSISIGINQEKDEFAVLRFFIKNKGKCERTRISIEEYSTYFKCQQIDLANRFLINQDTETIKINVFSYLKEVSNLLKIMPLDEVLYADKWINIAIDWDPYR